MLEVKTHKPSITEPFPQIKTCFPDHQIQSATTKKESSGHNVPGTHTLTKHTSVFDPSHYKKRETHPPGFLCKYN